MTDARAVAAALGGDLVSSCKVLAPGPGHSPKDRSLCVDFDSSAPDGFLVHSFAGDDWRACRDYVRSRLGLPQWEPGRTRSVAITPRPVEQPEHVACPDAIEVWGMAGRGPGSIIERYLNARGITIEPPPALRCGGGCYFNRLELPTMVAAVQAPDRRTVAIQLTLIDPRGDRKAQVRLPRRTVGALGWGAVRLAGATDVLGLAEGTEKALAAMQLFAVPCWSSLGAGRMHRVWIPDHVSELHIFVDNDDPGRAGAERTAHAHRHRKVVLHFPPEQFKDWDDVTQARMRGVS
jgi:putative DNA primase/helicase